MIAWKGMGFANTNRKMMECYEKFYNKSYKESMVHAAEIQCSQSVFGHLYIASGVVLLICFLMTFGDAFKNRKQFYPQLFCSLSSCFCLLKICSTGRLELIIWGFTPFHLSESGQYKNRRQLKRLREANCIFAYKLNTVTNRLKKK